MPTMARYHISEILQNTGIRSADSITTPTTTTTTATTINQRISANLNTNQHFAVLPTVAAAVSLVSLAVVLCHFAVTATVLSTHRTTKFVAPNLIFQSSHQSECQEWQSGKWQWLWPRQQRMPSGRGTLNI